MKSPVDLLNDAILEACAEREEVQRKLKELEPLQASLRKLEETIALNERAVAHLKGGTYRSNWRKKQSCDRRNARQKAQRATETPEERDARLHKRALGCIRTR